MFQNSSPTISLFTPCPPLFCFFYFFDDFIHFSDPYCEESCKYIRYTLLRLVKVTSYVLQLRKVVYFRYFGQESLRLRFLSRVFGVLCSNRLEFFFYQPTNLKYVKNMVRRLLNPVISMLFCMLNDSMPYLIVFDTEYQLELLIPGLQILLFLSKGQHMF